MRVKKTAAGSELPPPEGEGKEARNAGLKTG